MCNTHTHTHTQQQQQQQQQEQSMNLLHMAGYCEPVVLTHTQRLRLFLGDSQLDPTVDQ